MADTVTYEASTEPSAEFNTNYLFDSSTWTRWNGYGAGGIVSTRGLTPHNAFPDVDTEHWEEFTIPSTPNDPVLHELDNNVRKLHLYESNIGIDTSVAVRDNTEKLLETMGHAELVWSDRKYKLSLIYPYVYTTGVSYVADDIVQMTDSNGRIDMFRCYADTSLPPVSGSLADDVVNGWKRDVIAFYVTDDHLLDGDTAMEISWPSSQNRYNFVTVKFLNETLDFEEDSVSWPSKLGIVDGESVDKGEWSAITGYDTSDIVSFGGVKYQLVNGKNRVSTGTPPTDGMWTLYDEDALYRKFMEADGNIPQEAEFFEEGITNIYHALARAEQRVRTSRMTVVYKFKLSRECFALEPGDLIHLTSGRFFINGEILRIEEFNAVSNKTFEVTASTFRAEMLAWNVADTEETPYVRLHSTPIAQATNLRFSRTPDKVTAGRLEWDASNDPVVSQYGIYVSTALSVNSQTPWTLLGRTNKLYYDIPSNFSVGVNVAVAAMSAEGRAAPRWSYAYASSWPYFIIGYGAFLPPNPTGMEFIEENGFLRLQWNDDSVKITRTKVVEGDFFTGTQLANTSDNFVKLDNVTAGQHTYTARSYNIFNIGSVGATFVLDVPITPALDDLEFFKVNGELYLRWSNKGSRFYIKEVVEGSGFGTGTPLYKGLEDSFKVSDIAAGMHVFYTRATARYGVHSEITRIELMLDVEQLADMHFEENNGILSLVLSRGSSDIRDFSVYENDVDVANLIATANDSITIPFITSGEHTYKVVSNTRYGAVSDAKTFVLTVPETPALVSVTTKKIATGLSAVWSSLGSRAASFDVSIIQNGSVIEEILGWSTTSYVFDYLKAGEYTVRTRSTAPYGASSIYTDIPLIIDAPQDITNFLMDGSNLLADDITEPWFDGIQIRFNPFTDLDWNKAHPVHAGLLSSFPYDASGLPSGSLTLMAKVFDKAGNESANTANIMRDIGERDIANVIETLKLLEGTGAATGISHVKNTAVDVHLISNSIDSFYGADNQNFYGADGAPFYDTGDYPGGEWTSDPILITSSVKGSKGYPSVTLTGATCLVFYREINTGDFYEDEVSPFYGPSLEAFYGTSMIGPWLPLAEFVISDNPYQFKIVIPPSTVQTDVTAFDIVIDAPDVEEYQENVTVPLAGLNVSTAFDFTAIKSVWASLQPLASGAVSITIDKTIPDAPVIFAKDTSGSNVGGAKVDLRIRGY